MYHILRRSLIRRYRDVVNDGDAEERFDVGIVGLGLEGVPEEDDEVDETFGDLGAYLLVAAERAGEVALYVQTGGVRHQFGGGARAAEFEFGQRGLVGQRPLDHLVFFVVMRYKRHSELFLHIFCLLIGCFTLSTVCFGVQRLLFLSYHNNAYCRRRAHRDNGQHNGKRQVSFLPA